MSDEALKLQMAPPSACPICGMAPDQMQEEYGAKWLQYMLEGTTFVMFQCPNCHVMCGNIHAVENSKLLAKKEKEMKERSPILKPGKNIILPRMGLSKN